MKDFDKHNDPIFRQRIKTHEFEFEPAAWDKMEQMLDDEDPRKIVGWRYPYMMILLGVFFVGISFFSPIENSSAPVVAAIDHTKQQIQTNKAETTETVKANTITTDLKQEEVVAKTTINKSASSTAVSIVEKTKAIIEKATVSNTVSKQTTITTTKTTTQIPNTEVREFIQQLPAILKEQKQENIQAFMQLDNNELKPLEMEDLLTETLPIEMSPLLMDKKKVKIGVQAGASVVLAKRSTADQGKLATAVGGFVNFELNDKNTIAVEANYKNGYSNGLASLTSISQRLDDMSTEPELLDGDGEESYVMKAGYSEVNNINRVHAVEIPVIYKRKITARNSVIGGVKPSIMKFSTSTEASNNQFADLRSTANTHFDLGLVAGIEHKFTKNLAVDLRYNQGLIDISDVDQVSNFNSDLALTVKYTF